MAASYNEDALDEKIKAIMSGDYFASAGISTSPIVKKKKKKKSTSSDSDSGSGTTPRSRKNSKSPATTIPPTVTEDSNEELIPNVNNESTEAAPAVSSSSFKEVQDSFENPKPCEVPKMVPTLPRVDSFKETQETFEKMSSSNPTSPSVSKSASGDSPRAATASTAISTAASILAPAPVLAAPAAQPSTASKPRATVELLPNDEIPSSNVDSLLFGPSPTASDNEDSPAKDINNKGKSDVETPSDEMAETIRAVVEPVKIDGNVAPTPKKPSDSGGSGNSISGATPVAPKGNVQFAPDVVEPKKKPATPTAPAPVAPAAPAPAPASRGAASPKPAARGGMEKKPSMKIGSAPVSASPARSSSTTGRSASPARGGGGGGGGGGGATYNTLLKQNSAQLKRPASPARRPTNSNIPKPVEPNANNAAILAAKSKPNAPTENSGGDDGGNSTAPATPSSSSTRPSSAASSRAAPELNKRNVPSPYGVTTKYGTRRPEAQKSEKQEAEDDDEEEEEEGEEDSLNNNMSSALTNTANATPSRDRRTPGGDRGSSRPAADQQQSHPVRPVRVAVRVRPFTEQEMASPNGPRRCLSKSGKSLIVVNPASFDAEPDTVAAAAIAMDNKQWAHTFQYDHCLWSYDPSTTEAEYIDQQGVYDAVGEEIVDNALNGVSTSCFAYGHTSTGKTYSLFGSSDEDIVSGSQNNVSAAPTPFNGTTISAQAGLIPRVFREIIDRTNEKDVFGNEVRMFISFLEIYNDKIRDLLTESPIDYTDKTFTGVQQQMKEEALKVREHPLYGPYVENLNKIEISCTEDALKCISQGLANRTSSSTAGNAQSSRSHAVVTLELAPVNIDEAIKVISPTKATRAGLQHSASASHVSAMMSQTMQPDTGARHGSPAKREIQSQLIVPPPEQMFVRVQMVDLAGSEKDGTMAAESGGNEEKIWNGSRYHDSTPSKSRDDKIEREKIENKSIRRSLSTLGYIIKSLSKGMPFKSLPYRDSQLTFLLRDALNGRNHTTMLCTVSPSDKCFEETLASLRYAERLVVASKSRPTGNEVANLMSGSPSSNGSMDVAIRDSRKLLMDEFGKIHEGLGGNKPHTPASRQLLKQTISDPQQRIAKMSKVVYTTTDGRNETEGAAGHKSDALTVVSTPSKGMTPTGRGQQGRTPIDHSKGVGDVSNADLNQLKNSYRSLQAQTIELQIDLDTVRADRDSLQVELQNAQNQLVNGEGGSKTDKTSAVMQLAKSFKAAEKEVHELRGQLRRKDETIERCLNDLSDAKQARVNAEQNYHARTKEFLARYELMKKENAHLTAQLEGQTDSNDDKRELFQQLEKNKAAASSLSKFNEALTQQNEKLIAENTELKDKMSTLLQNITAAGKDEQKIKILQGENDRLRSAVDDVSNERNSLLSVVKQKDALLELQGNVHGMNNANNNNKGGNSDSAVKNELDQKLLATVKDLTNRVQDYELRAREFEVSKSIRADLERQLKAANAKLSQQGGGGGGGGADASDMDVLALRAENWQLREQLDITYREGLASKEELKNANDSMQREFAALWLSVQELNKLDVMKDKSIQDLIADRDAAVAERNNMANLLTNRDAENAALRDELEQIDQDLLDAVESEEFRFNPDGNGKSVTLHNVSDRMLDMLAKRHEDMLQQQHSPGKHPPPSSARRGTPRASGSNSNSNSGTTPLPPSGAHRNNVAAAPPPPGSTSSSRARNSNSNSGSSFNSFPKAGGISPSPRASAGNAEPGSGGASGRYRERVSHSIESIVSSNHKYTDVHREEEEYKSGSNSARNSSGRGPAPISSRRGAPPTTTTTTTGGGSGGGNRRTPAAHSRNDDYDDDDGDDDDQERLLERQIGELTDYLQDEAKLKKARSGKTPKHTPTTKLNFDY